MALKKTGTFPVPYSSTPLPELYYRWVSTNIDLYQGKVDIAVYAFADPGVMFDASAPGYPPKAGAAIDRHSKTVTFTGQDFMDLATAMETPSASGLAYPGISDLIYSKLATKVLPGDEVAYFADAETV